MRRSSFKRLGFILLAFAGFELVNYITDKVDADGLQPFLFMLYIYLIVRISIGKITFTEFRDPNTRNLDAELRKLLSSSAD